MDLLILLITIVAAVVQAKNKSEKKKERSTGRRNRSAFERAEQMEWPESSEGSYRPGADEGRSGREVNIERQRQLKAELKRKYQERRSSPSSAMVQAMEDSAGGRYAAELREAAQSARDRARRAPSAEHPRQGEPGREGRSRTTAAVTGAYSDEYLGSMLYDSGEGEGHVARDYRLEELTAKSDDHVVKAFTESSHSHAESSVSGADCPPSQEEEREDAYQAALTRRQAAGIGLNAGTLREAILYSEVLARPKALRRGRI